MFKLILIFLIFIGSSFTQVSCILNGTDAEIEEFPHQINIWKIFYDRNLPSYNNTHWCTGALINSYWVVTNGMCVLERRFILDGLKFEKSHIIFFGNNSLQNWKNKTHLGHEIEKLVFAPNRKSDLVLIKLKKPVQINNKTIKPACFIRENTKQVRYENLIATGWGMTHLYVNEYSNILQKSQNLTDVSDDKPYFVKVNPGQNSFGSTCDGDTGANLVYQKNNQKYVVGLNFNSECGYTSKFTRISYHLDFIEKTIDSSICVKNLSEL